MKQHGCSGPSVDLLGVFMSSDLEFLLVNVKRQSKRLSKILSCSLGQAQEGLAICVYGCLSYGDFLKKIKSNKFDNPLLALTGLSPNSEIFLLKILESNLNSIVLNFEKKFPDSSIDEKLVVSLFGITFDEYTARVSSQ